jgi:hypothetical protein
MRVEQGRGTERVALVCHLPDDRFIATPPSGLRALRRRRGHADHPGLGGVADDRFGVGLERRRRHCETRASGDFQVARLSGRETSLAAVAVLSLDSGRRFPVPSGSGVVERCFEIRSRLPDLSKRRRDPESQDLGVATRTLLPSGSWRSHSRPASPASSTAIPNSSATALMSATFR